MNEQYRTELRAVGFTTFQVEQYEPGKSPELDCAARCVQEHVENDIDGSVQESAAGGLDLQCHIELVDDWFVVWLPPRDDDWGRKSQSGASGFTPTMGIATKEFKRWLDGLP